MQSKKHSCAEEIPARLQRELFSDHLALQRFSALSSPQKQNVINAANHTCNQNEMKFILSHMEKPESTNLINHCPEIK